MRFLRALRRRIPCSTFRRSAGSTGRAVEQPPHLVGVSFAIGLFVATLPTPGLDTVTLVAIGWRFEWANRWAFGLALAILNPVVKSFVYVGSFALGTALLGPGGGAAGLELSLAAGPHILSRLVVGNVIIAVVVAGTGYLVARYWASIDGPAVTPWRPSTMASATSRCRPRLPSSMRCDRLPMGGAPSLRPIRR